MSRIFSKKSIVIVIGGGIVIAFISEYIRNRRIQYQRMQKAFRIISPRQIPILAKLSKRMRTRHIKDRAMLSNTKEDMELIFKIAREKERQLMAELRYVERDVLRQMKIDVMTYSRYVENPRFPGRDFEVFKECFDTIKVESYKGNCLRSLSIFGEYLKQDKSFGIKNDQDLERWVEKKLPMKRFILIQDKLAFLKTSKILDLIYREISKTGNFNIEKYSKMRKSEIDGFFESDEISKMIKHEPTLRRNVIYGNSVHPLIIYSLQGKIYQQKIDETHLLPSDTQRISTSILDLLQNNFSLEKDGFNDLRDYVREVEAIIKKVSDLVGTEIEFESLDWI